MKKMTYQNKGGPLAVLVSATMLGLLASASTLAADAPAAPAAKEAKPAAKIPNPRTAMTGQWNRYPEIDEKPSPEFPPAAPIPPPPLKAKYKAEWEAHRKMLAD